MQCPPLTLPKSGGWGGGIVYYKFRWRTHGAIKSYSHRPKILSTKYPYPILLGTEVLRGYTELVRVERFFLSTLKLIIM